MNRTLTGALLAFLALFGCVGYTFPTTSTVTGHVTYEATHKPASGLIVEAWNPKDGPQNPGWDAEKHRVVTDSNGKYTITGVPRGTYVIQVSTTDRVWKATSSHIKVPPKTKVDVIIKK